MGEFSFFVQLRFIYIYILIYMTAGYFYDSWLKKIGYYGFIENYFGWTIIFIFFILLLNMYSFFIGCTRKRMVYNIRKNFFIILVLSVFCLWFMYSLDVPFEKSIADEKLLQLSIDNIFYKYRFGLISVYLFNTLLQKIQFFYLYIILYVLIFISTFFIIAKRVRSTIKIIVENRREKKRLRIERQLIQEQIELMERLERKEKQEREGISDDTGV